MRGSFGRWLLTAAAVMLIAVIVLGLTLVFGLAHADALLDRAGRSQAQLAFGYRLQASSTALMTADPVLRREASEALKADLAGYRASIITETRTLDFRLQNYQGREMHRAAILSGLASRMEGETGRTLDEDAAKFRATVQAIVVREEAEAAEALQEMHALRRHAILVAIALPLGLAISASWLLWTMHRMLVSPLARLRRSALSIGQGTTDVLGMGFADFAPLEEAIVQADQEIVRQREALADANRTLEFQVFERTSSLARQNERLATIDTTRRLFFSQVGHELRTPITVIMGEAEVVLRDVSAGVDRYREGLHHIVLTGAFLARRIDDLLAVARAEDGRLTLIRTRLDFGDIVRATETIAKPYAASAGVTLTVDAPWEPMPIDGDASWLQQALLALIDNAIRHAAHGGAHIIVSARQGKDGICVTVEDDGPGVESDLLAHVFDAWSQAAGVRGGSGLGLAVSRWVTEAHGGMISACNTSLGGFAVTIRVPAA